MGNTAEIEKEDLENTTTGGSEPQEPGYGGEVPTGNETANAGEVKTPEKEEESSEEEFDVVLRDQEGSQPPKDKNAGIRKRINKVLGERDQARGAAKDSDSQLEVEREKNKLLELALKQKEGPVDKVPTMPNPEDFDGGAYNPDFIKEQGAYTQHLVDSKIADAVAAAQQTAKDNQAVSDSEQEMEAKKDLHYQKAEKLQVKDYEGSEVSARQVLGDNLADDIIMLFSDVDDGLPTSEAILFHYGKNKEAAARLKDLARANPGLAIGRVGSVRAQIQIVRKNKTLPDPDEQLKGGSVGGSSKRSKGAKFY